MNAKPRRDGAVSADKLFGMLNRARQTAPTVALLICVALLAAWLTGAHAHRHVGGAGHKQSLHAGSAVDSAHTAGHGHDGDFSSASALDHGTAEHSESGHSDAHSFALIHEDGHENIEFQALQLSPGKAALDFPLLLLLCCAVLALARTQTLVVRVIPDPPDPKPADWSLRPPLRGPPSFSVV